MNLPLSGPDNVNAGAGSAFSGSFASKVAACVAVSSPFASITVCSSTATIEAVAGGIEVTKSTVGASSTAVTLMVTIIVSLLGRRY